MISATKVAVSHVCSTSPLRFPSPESKSCKLQRPGFNLSWSRESFRGDTLDTSKQHLSVEKISARYAIWSFGGRKKFGLNKIASPCWCIPYYSVVFLSSSSFRKYQGWHFPTPNMNLFSRETVRNISPLATVTARVWSPGLLLKVRNHRHLIHRWLNLQSCQVLVNRDGKGCCFRKRDGSM